MKNALLGFSLYSKKERLFYHKAEKFQLLNIINKKLIEICFFVTATPATPVMPGGTPGTPSSKVKVTHQTDKI